MSTLRTNALEGVDAKNSITIVAGAGNITTTNVQEGLSKAWVNFSMAGTTARSSFNFSSLTDAATGKFNVTMATPFSDTNYVATGYSSGYASAGFVANQSHGIAVENRLSRTTTAYAFDSYIGSYVDSIENRALVQGDLA